MSFSYKKWIGAGLGILFLVIIGAAGMSQTLAQSSVAACPAGTQLYGWAWSSTIGWISFNSTNAGSGGAPHCVSIDSSGNLKGFAWSPNVGWIRFGDLLGFPVTGSTAGNARIGTPTTSIVGWARACAGSLPGDCSSKSSRSDGWDGWIELTGVNHTLAYNSTTGAITGYGWGSSVAGWISFNLTSAPPATSTASCQLTNARVGNSGMYRLTWSSSNAASCSGNNFTGTGLSGSTTVTPTGTTIYTMSCTPTTGTTNAFCSTTVTVGGTGNECTPGSPGCSNVQDPAVALSMWLDNDPAEAKEATRIRVGQAASVNWESTQGEVYSGCFGGFDDEEYVQLPIERPTGNPYVKKGLGVGAHTFELECDISGGSQKRKGLSATGRPFLKIEVIDPTLRED